MEKILDCTLSFSQVNLKKKRQNRTEDVLWQYLIHKENHKKSITGKKRKVCLLS